LNSLPDKAAHDYKCGQTVDIIISCDIKSCEHFFIQKVSRLDELKTLEDYINNHSMTITQTEGNQLEEFYNFQKYCQKSDLILFRSERTNLWNRAVIKEILTANEIINNYGSDSDSDSDSDFNSSSTKTDLKVNGNLYYTFDLIDYGRCETVVVGNRDSNNKLFILPFDDKLLIGPFALQCKLNTRSFQNNDNNSKERWMFFEKQFAELAKDSSSPHKDKQRVFNMRITQITCHRIKEALVELYLMEDDFNKLTSTQQNNSTTTTTTTTNDVEVLKRKLFDYNLVNFISKKYQQLKVRNFVTQCLEQH
jgi:hypothetical protein